MLVELVNGICIDVKVVVWRVASEVLLLIGVSSILRTSRAKSVGAWLLFNPEVLWWFEVIPED